MLYEIALGIWRTFPPILFVFGTIGNLMTIIVLMQRRNRNSSIARYLTALAIADLIVLWVLLPRNWLYNEFGVDVRSFSKISCKLHLFVVYFGSQSSSSYVVIVTIERFISTWLPTKVKGTCTARNSNIVIICVSASLALLNSHFLFGMGNTNGKSCYPLDESYAYFLFNIRPFISLLGFSLTPLVILVTVNTSIIVRVLMMRWKSRTQVLPQPITSSELARKAKIYQVTTMLVTLNVVYMVCVTPLFVFLIFYSDWVVSHGNDHSEAVLELIWAIICALFYTNNAVNFILYFLSGSILRKAVMDIFCRRLKLLSHHMPTEYTF